MVCKIFYNKLVRSKTAIMPTPKKTSKTPTAEDLLL
jgi:hypothetical protein